jgi:hypothetical protein
MGKAVVTEPKPCAARIIPRNRHSLIKPRYGDSYLKASSGRSASDLRRSQRDFLSVRNASFGRPGYDLRKVMQERLQRLNAMDG